MFQVDELSGSLGDMEDVIRHRQDVAIGSFFLTHDREKTVDRLKSYSVSNNIVRDKY